MNKKTVLWAGILAAIFSPAQAAFVAPALEVESGPRAIHTALVAPFDHEDQTETQPGHVQISREVMFGETARRAESCSEMAQALAEGFDQIIENTTPYTDGWLRARCETLDILDRAAINITSAETPAPLNENVVQLLPPIISGRSSCAEAGAALRATLRGENWVSFESALTDGGPLPIRVQPAAQFDVIAASGRAQDALVVTVRGANQIGLLADDAVAMLERLAVYPANSKDQQITLFHLTWKNPVFGVYRSEIVRLAQAKQADVFTPAQPGTMLAGYVENCPDHLGNVLNGPVDIQ